MQDKGRPMQDKKKQAFNLADFLPYLLNQAAEVTGEDFHTIYRREYNLTRTQWRIIANLGKFGAMTAATICRISHIEKTKVSRAVAALEARGFIERTRDAADRRTENLSLTDTGQAVFADLGQKAKQFDEALRSELGPGATQLETMLRTLINRHQER